MENSHIQNYLDKFGEFNEDEKIFFESHFKKISAKKRQYLIQPNFPVQSRYYVVSGALRGFVVDDSGKEHTVAFAVEDWWITDYNNYIFQKPATMFVQALEDCVLMKIDFEDEVRLKTSDQKFENVFRIMAERGLAFIHRRLISSISESAENRYDHFLAKYPQIAQRIPQYVLASYLGMTTEFLSKIRNKKVKRK